MHQERFWMLNTNSILCARLKQLLRDQSNDEENKQPIPSLAAVNELKPLNPPEREMISLDKYKLEVEQRVNKELRIILNQLFSSRNILRIFYDTVIVNYNN